MANTSTGLAQSLVLGLVAVGIYDLEKVCIVHLFQQRQLLLQGRVCGKHPGRRHSAPTRSEMAYACTVLAVRQKDVEPG
eukprot:scaffold242699_cov17-Tisochrysis_lutea.AAC.1